MALKIRKAAKGDTPSLSRICLLTANSGTSAEELHDFGELPGLVYAIPYVILPTTWGFVLEDEEHNEVVGYIVGSTDTCTYERYAAEHWWPSLAIKYPLELSTKAGDVQYAKLLRNMHTSPDMNISFSPAHLHINILPNYQKQGWGRRLIATAIEFLKDEGLSGVWLGLNPRNEGAREFYERVGFKVIGGSVNATYMGLKFEKPFIADSN
ncbi:acyl-CoA N-acyltransferase [Phlegmacium glaucopus]|nr:acyl-CoA N-acyltransferase [Phlegmacium glaucopus]